MKVRRFLLGPLNTNSHVLVSGNQAVAVDVGGDPKPVMSFLRKNALTLQAVLLTHLHCDHVYGVGELATTLGVKVYAGAEDKELMDSELGRGGLAWLPLVPKFTWAALAPGETTILGQPCQVMATPGHSAGSRSYYFPQAGIVFVGDLLSQRSIGRTDLMSGDHEVLIRSVTHKIFPLPDDTKIYPGHGPSSTVGDEKCNNPYLSAYAQ